MANIWQNIKNGTVNLFKNAAQSIKTNFQRSAYQREIILLVVIAFVLLAVIIISSIVNNRSTVVNLPKENSSITSGNFTLTNENGKIYVETRDLDITDKDTIRKKLGIPDSVDFEVIVPGAAGERSFDDDPTYNPPKIEVPNEDLGD